MTPETNKRGSSKITYRRLLVGYLRRGPPVGHAGGHRWRQAFCSLLCVAFAVQSGEMLLAHVRELKAFFEERRPGAFLEGGSTEVCQELSVLPFAYPIAVGLRNLVAKP